MIDRDPLAVRARNANKAGEGRIDHSQKLRLFSAHDIGAIGAGLRDAGQNANVAVGVDTNGALVQRIKGTPEEKPIAALMLRTMQKARYAPENLGHFGLAFSDYTHFTSPIRRYPDLVVHRLLREAGGW